MMSEKDKTEATKSETINLELELDGVAHLFTFKRPRREHLAMATSGSADKVYSRMNQMVIACLTNPERAEAVELFDTFPGAVMTLGNSLLEAVGLGRAERRP
jgi:hypothetical protein